MIGGLFASIVLSPNQPGPVPCAVVACLPHRSQARPSHADLEGWVQRHGGARGFRARYVEAGSEAPVRAKYRELAPPHLTPAGMDAIEAAVDRCEEWKTMGELIEPLRMHASWSHSCPSHGAKRAYAALFARPAVPRRAGPLAIARKVGDKAGGEPPEEIQ